MKYCPKEGCSGSFIGIPDNEARDGKYCPGCGSSIDYALKLRLKRNIGEFKNDVQNLGRKIGRKRMKKVLIGLLAGVSLTVGGLSVFNGYSNIVNSAEYLRASELDKKAIQIMPYNGSTSYQLDGGNNVIVYRAPGARLSLSINDKIRLLSEDWVVSGPEGGTSAGDARNLAILRIRLGNEWVTIPRSEIVDYNSWQAAYEGLIDKLSDMKHESDTQTKSEAEIELEKALRRVEIVKAEQGRLKQLQEIVQE